MVIRNSLGGVLWCVVARCEGALSSLQVERQAMLDGLILAEVQRLYYIRVLLLKVIVWQLSKWSKILIMVVYGYLWLVILDLCFLFFKVVNCLLFIEGNQDVHNLAHYDIRASEFRVWMG